MNKKIVSLLIATISLVFSLSGCVRSDIGVKIMDNGTGSIAATLGIEKDAYEEFVKMGSDPFDGKTTTEYTYDGSTYIAYTEIKEYASYEEMEKALLELTYDTEFEEYTQVNKDNEGQIKDESRVLVNDIAMTDVPIEFETIPEEDKSKNIFSSVSIEKNSGMFYTIYSFNATANPSLADEMSENKKINLTLTVEMPGEINENIGGQVDGNKITYDIANINDSREFTAICESNNAGLLIGIVLLLIVVICVLVFLVKSKK